MKDEEYIQIEYETLAPLIREEQTIKGKLVKVSLPDEEDLAKSLTNILAYTTIPEIYRLDQKDKIKLRWLTNNNQEMDFEAFDLNENGRIDYLEWIVPHLSEQVFEIIFISKAFKLNENWEVIEDIYDQVRYQDNNFASLLNNQYLRVTF